MINAKKEYIRSLEEAMDSHISHNNHNRLSKCLLLVISLLMFFYPIMIAHSFSIDDGNCNLQKDKNIKMIQDGSDVWFWNREIIKRHHKSTDTWTYYWSPIKYKQLEIQWDQKSRTILYFLDGNQITAQQVKAFAIPGSGLPVGSKIPIGNPQFCLQISSSPPLFGKQEKKRLLKRGVRELKNRYQQKYRPQYWTFTALAVTDDYVWAAVRSIPRRPESINRFILPNGFVSSWHFRESSAMPVQGGILKINKDTGEYTRFTEEKGLPEKLLCRPLSEESRELPHFLPFRGFPQEVVDIEPLENGRIRFTTRSNQQVFYDFEQGKWQDAQ